MEISEEVLLLDDDPAMLVFLEGILSSAGHTCRTESDPATALSQVATRQQIGLVVSDVYMPGMTGLQFIDRLHALPLTWPAPRVLLLTAQPSLESAIDALRLGAQDFLVKPIRPPELIDAISRGLARAQADRAVDPTRPPEIKRLVRQAEELVGRLRNLAYDSDMQRTDALQTGAAVAEAPEPQGGQREPARPVTNQQPAAAAPLSVLDTIEQLRRLREQYTQHGLDDVEWDLLLELLRAERLHQRLSVSALTISATGASATTSLRRLNHLVSRGYVIRIPDASDARRDFVSLTDKSNELLADYLTRANSHLRQLGG
jgi:CheY-like chemotaxis protein/DNA-binding MarR family transcriptional regulator